MRLGLEDKTVVIAGGGSKLGRSLALLYTAEGSRVFLSAEDETMLESVRRDVEAAGLAITAIHAGAASRAEAQVVIDRAVEATGRLDVLVTAMAHWAGRAFFIDNDPDTWTKIVHSNFIAVLNTIHAALPHMVRQGSGNIVAISSEAGRVGEFKAAVYSGARGAVIAACKSIAKEVAPQGVRVNVVCTGATQPEGTHIETLTGPWRGEERGSPDYRMQRATAHYPLGRLGHGDDTANAVLYLSSDAASFVTGQTLSVSGGFTML